jgi:tetraacyldisaccharide 4'-kinase
VTGRVKTWLGRAVHALWFGQGPSVSALALALSPLGKLTRRHARIARQAIEQLPRPDPPVLVIGNLLAGGTGKTPLVIAVAQALQTRGLRLGLLCSGYGAARADARLVRPTDDPVEHGDEAVLLAMETGAPVAAGRRRDQALACLLAGYPDLDLVIADDGLQHRWLPRSLELVVFDRRGLGNGRLLPAGPLREPLPAGGQLAAIALNDAETPTGIHPTRCFRFTVEPTSFARADGSEQISTRQFRDRVAGDHLTALAGIGEPARFFESLATCGIHPQTRLSLPDHAPIGRATLGAIQSPHIVMTAKDAVKCRGFADQRCWVLRVAARVDPALIDWLLRDLLRGNKTA